MHFLEGNSWEASSKIGVCSWVMTAKMPWSARIAAWKIHRTLHVKYHLIELRIAIINLKNANTRWSTNLNMCVPP